MEITHWEVNKTSNKWVNLRYVAKAIWNIPFCESLWYVNCHTCYLRDVNEKIREVSLRGFFRDWASLHRTGAQMQLSKLVSHNFQFREVGREIRVTQCHMVDQWHSWDQKPSLSES